MFLACAAYCHYIHCEEKQLTDHIPISDYSYNIPIGSVRSQKWVYSDSQNHYIIATIHLRLIVLLDIIDSL